MALFVGGCHCGQVRLEFITEKEPADFIPRIDRCGFCVRHRAIAIADPGGQMAVHLPANSPEPYRFELKITDFHICDRCGVWVAATWNDGDKMFGVINVPALDDRELFGGTPIVVDFDHEDVATREARRRSNWTPASVLLSTG